MQMKALRAVFTIIAISVLSLTQSSRAEIAYADGFEFFKARQKTPVWCWAACIQMMLNYKSVEWRQEDIVTAVKGYLKSETASDGEIAQFLNQWGFDYDGAPWASRCAYYRGAPRPDWLVSELAQDRPLIVSYQTGPRMGHVVVLHQVDFTPTDFGPVVNSVRIYDPFTDAHYSVNPQGVLQTTTAHWFVDVRKRRR